MGKVMRVALVIFLAITALTSMRAQQEEVRVLEVGVYNAAPYAFTSSDGFFEGIMVDLWREIAEDLEYQYNLTLVDMDGALNGVRAGDFDLAIGAITVTPERESIVDFSHGVTPTGLVTMLSVDQVQGKFDIYYKPILWSLLKIILILVTFMFASATLVWLIERKHRYHEREKQIRHIGDGIWWSAVTISTVGYGDKVPHSAMGRVVGIGWIFIGVTMVSLFTANAAAILSRPVPTMHVTFQDLGKLDIAAVDNSAAAEYFNRHHIDYHGYATVEDAIDDLRAGAKEAFVGDARLLHYLTKEVYPGDFVISDNVLMTDYMAFALPENSPLVNSINIALINHINEPQWQRILFKPLNMID